MKKYVFLCGIGVATMLIGAWLYPVLGSLAGFAIQVCGGWLAWYSNKKIFDSSR